MTLSSILPGPNLVNLCVYLGLELVGFWQMLLPLLALALPGAVLAVIIVNLVDLQQPNLRTLLQGFSIGSIAIFAVFVGSTVKSFVEKRKNEITFKKILQFGIFASTTGLVYFGFSIPLIIAAGIMACMAVEFLTPHAKS